MLEINKVREFFPHLKTDQVYFNHASLGVLSQQVLARIDDYLLERSITNIMNYQTYLIYYESSKKKLGDLIGASPERIAYCDNVSNALNIPAQGIKWESGDRIILNDIEFPSNIYPFLNLRSQGVEIDIIKSHDGKILIEDIEKAITPRTKLISISLVQFLSGFRSDIKTISKMCKERGTIFVVDGIQAAGAVSIDLSDIDVDFFAGGTQKWLLGMQGLSYFYISENLQEQLKQKFVGWLSVDDSWNLLNYNLTLKSSAERFQNGTLNALGVAVLDRTLDLFLEFGKERVQQLILDNTKYFISQLNEIGITPVLNNLPDENLSGIVTFKHPKAEKLFVDLEAAKIFAAMRGGMIRFSPHFYNSHNEIDRVIDFLKEWK
ncbi:hypothetical protein APF79_13700 [bacterium BRH_c32]|nr:MAG: hypothetical protein APF79_13700 [bacterium BRH_c32]